MAPRARAGHAGRRLTARAATVESVVNAHDRKAPSGEPAAVEHVTGNHTTHVPQITLISKRDVPALMSKRIALDSAGKLVSDGSECLMTTGTAARAFAGSASALPAPRSTVGRPPAVAAVIRGGPMIRRSDLETNHHLLQQKGTHSGYGRLRQ